MFGLKQKKVMAVHSGEFHADDVFAVATIMLAFPKWRISVLRTRDDSKILKADIVADVGGVFSPLTMRFDHHQTGGAGMRGNGIPFASFGLVWKEFGEKICGNIDVANEIDRSLVSPIDASDNGILVSRPVTEGVYPYLIEYYIYSFRPTWRENENDIDSAFLRAVTFAKNMLAREIIKVSAMIDARAKVRAIYESSTDKSVIVFDDKYPWEAVSVLSEYPEPLFTLCPNPGDGFWHAKCVRNGSHTFENRRSFPASWAGKRDGDLANITGVEDAVFCHNKLFLAVAKTKEGGLKLIEKALI